MPYQMLKFLVTVSGPTVLTEPDDIERVLLLQAAKLVDADIPHLQYSDDGHAHYAGAAVIYQVTESGRKLACRQTNSAVWS